MENKIKNTLFRFVNLRSPQLPDEKKKTKRFIFFPETLHSGSYFYDAAADSDTKWETLKDLSKMFEEAPEYYPSDQQIKTDLNNIYEFSVWLIRNRSTSDKQELEAKIQEVTSPTVPSPVLAKLWDNLFYQIVSQKSFYTKELIMQLLLANHVLNEMRPVPEDSDYTDFPNARIVLPPEMFLNAEGAEEVGSRPPEYSQVRSFPTNEMKKKQENALSKINIGKAEVLLKELEKLDKNYHRERQDGEKLIEFYPKQKVENPKKK